MGKRSRKRAVAEPLRAAERPPAPERPRPRARAAAAPRAGAAPRQDPARAANWTRGYGERPLPVWGRVPVTEIAIAAGIVALAIGLAAGNESAVIVGAVVCGLAVVELTLREHMSGFRSHTAFLAFAPVVALLAVLSTAAGIRGPVALAIAAPVFAGLFFALRAAFGSARQARTLRR